MDFGLHQTSKDCVRDHYFSVKTQVSSKLKLIISLCSLVFLSQRAFELINCQNAINVNNSFNLVRNNSSNESNISPYESLIKNHRMNPDEVPKLSVDSLGEDIRGHQNGLTFNVDFLEQPDQFEAGQRFFMASRQVPKLVPVHRQWPTETPQFHRLDHSASGSKWSIAINQPEHAQQDAIRITQDQSNSQLTPPPPPLPSTTLTSEVAYESLSNQTGTSLIDFDDENDVKNQTISRLADELERLKETERLLEKSLIKQRQIIRPKLINEINKQLTAETQSPIRPTDQTQNTNIKNKQDGLVVLRQTEESMRGILPKLNYVQHPRGSKNKSKMNKLSSLLKPSSNNEKKTIMTLHAQPTTTLPVVQMNPNAREGSMSGYNPIEDDNQYKRQFQMTSAPLVESNNNNFKNSYKPERKNDARFDRYPIDSLQNKQYQAYLKYMKSLESPNINFKLPKVTHHKVAWPNVYGSEHNVNKNKLQGFPITVANENEENSLLTATQQEDLFPPSASIDSDDIDPALYDGDVRDVNQYSTGHENRLPAASSHFEYSSHDYVPTASQFKIKSPHSMGMPSDIRQWPSPGYSTSSSLRPRRYPPASRYHHSSSGGSDYPATISFGDYHMPLQSARQRHHSYTEHRLAHGPSYHRTYKVRPIYESDEHHEVGGSHNHHKVIHIHTKEKKKYAKYLWPILGGGLTMLMGFLIISNMLLSIPLLAIGASSLFNHGGFHSQQLVPIYNLSQLQPPRGSGRRRKRWAGDDPAEVGDRIARIFQPRELLKRVLFSLSKSNRCRVATF